MLKGRYLLLRHIDDSNFRNSLVDMFRNLLHGSLVVFDMIGRSPFFIKFRQQPGNHIAWIGGQAQTVLFVRHCKRGYGRGGLQNHLGVFQDGLSKNRGLDALPISC